MQFHCPGCKLAIDVPVSGQMAVAIPEHTHRNGEDVCHWSGRKHTVTAPTVHTPAEDKRRREIQETKRAEESKARAEAAAKNKPTKAPPKVERKRAEEDAGE